MEGNKEIQKIRTDMKEIREMLDEIQKDTKYLLEFMKKYEIPMIQTEQPKKETVQKVERRAFPRI